MTCCACAIPQEGDAIRSPFKNSCWAVRLCKGRARGCSLRNSDSPTSAELAGLQTSSLLRWPVSPSLPLAWPMRRVRGCRPDLLQGEAADASTEASSRCEDHRGAREPRRERVGRGRRRRHVAKQPVQADRGDAGRPRDPRRARGFAVADQDAAEAAHSPAFSLRTRCCCARRSSTSPHATAWRPTRTRSSSSLSRRRFRPGSR